MDHVRLKTISLKNHSNIDERWLQQVIADDPNILKLGVGDVILKDKERRQKRAGRLDLLLQQADGDTRFEVEIQLGATDESHIIRTIEYWDKERKILPQYDHVAVIIAEDITSRFFNVISLFNGFIPLMAIQVTAVEMSEGTGLLFTKVLDTVRLATDEDDSTAETTDRNYWETSRGTPETVELADKILELSRLIEPNIELNYNKQYIGFLVDGRAKNFAIMKPQRSGMRLEIFHPWDESINEIIDAAELELIDYNTPRRSYRIKLSAKDFTDKTVAIADLLGKAYNARA